MKITTFSVVVGTSACDAACPFCVSHTTGFHNLPDSKTEINWQNFHKAVKLANMGGCTTLLFTGKGEPTLYPDELTNYLNVLEEIGNPFPLVELQTNAIRIGEMFSVPPANRTPQQRKLYNALLGWRVRGLNTIAISTVGIHSDWNKEIYLHHRDMGYPPLSVTIRNLRELGFSIRLCVMMQNGMTDSIEKVREVAQFCKHNGVAQLTVRPIRRPKSSLPILQFNTSEDKYIYDNGLTEQQEQAIRQGIDSTSTHILTLMNGEHQAKIYDMDGQNLCIADCLTVEAKSDNIRTLIFFSDGKLTYDWQYDGARLL